MGRNGMPINRVKDSYFDQYERTSQYEQLEDLRNICKLGIKRFRFPILWERHADNPAAWAFTKLQLDLLYEYEVEPIAGLLHHGSGPLSTNLNDPLFPYLLATYAGDVAKKFPSIIYYTPVNEPLTTARFSGLYGFWYPHAKDDRTFANIFLNQLKGIVLSMQAIRKFNPHAQLIQTEDLCKVHSTEQLEEQADFENARRWWTYDFLTCNVTRVHMAWVYFTGLGIDETALQFFLDNPCTPAVAGFNYYVSSERYLDHKTHLYDPILIGGNGRESYVDTEAARTGHSSGLSVLLKEAWKRYQLPMAVTECHINCTREQQLRWLQEQWMEVKKLNAAQIPVIAITSWALVGAYDWNSLVTIQNDHYESGAYTIGNTGMQPTALSSMIANMTAGKKYEHPALQGYGWWHSDGIHIRLARPLLLITTNVAERERVMACCKNRKLELVTANETDDLAALVNHFDAWGIITTNSDCGQLSAICRLMGIGFMLLVDGENIHLSLDQLIDDYECTSKQDSLNRKAFLLEYGT